MKKTIKPFAAVFAIIQNIQCGKPGYLYKPFETPAVEKIINVYE